MGLIQLLNKIGTCYEKIYEIDGQEEAEKVEKYTYGVWGHSIEDLSLGGINVNFATKKITIDVGS